MLLPLPLRMFTTTALTTVPIGMVITGIPSITITITPTGTPIMVRTTDRI